MRAVLVLALALAATPAAALQTSCVAADPDHAPLECEGDYKAVREAGYRVLFEDQSDVAEERAQRWLDRRAGRRGVELTYAETLMVAGRQVTVVARDPREGGYRLEAFDRAGRQVMASRGYGLAVKGDQVVVIGRRGYRPARWVAKSP